MAHGQQISSDASNFIVKYLEQIERLTRVKFSPIIEGKVLPLIPNNVSNSVQIIYLDSTFILNLMGSVDLGKERARLKKESESVRAELDKIALKLGNPQFIAKAKPKAIDEQREREAQGRAALARLDAALARLGSA
jgi:valyl-tRNA synthetase